MNKKGKDKSLTLVCEPEDAKNLLGWPKVNLDRGETLRCSDNGVCELVKRDPIKPKQQS
jgi:hypothetical protein